LFFYPTESSTPKPPKATTKHPSGTRSKTPVPSVVEVTTGGSVVEVTTGEHGGYTVVTTESTGIVTGSTVNKTTTIGTATRPMEQVGLIAGIVSAVLFVLVLVIAISGYYIYLRYTKRNIKSMHFENPVYRKTTEDQFIIPYGKDSSQNKKNNPVSSISLN